MKKLIFVWLVVLIAFPISAKEIPKKQWFEQMSNVFAGEFCKVVKIKDCEIISQHAVDMCLSQIWNKIPEKLQIPGDGKKLGAIVGTCVEETVRVVVQY